MIRRVYVRILLILEILKPKNNLCPPACSEGHTFEWPCERTIK